MTTWTKDSIQKLLDENPKAVQRAILAIYRRQTSEEQAYQTTRHSNGVGFGAFDAEFLSSLAQRLERGWDLSEKQLAFGRSKIKRYWRQLAEIANNGGR